MIKIRIITLILALIMAVGMVSALDVEIGQGSSQDGVDILITTIPTGGAAGQFQALGSGGITSPNNNSYFNSDFIASWEGFENATLYTIDLLNEDFTFNTTITALNPNNSHLIPITGLEEKLYRLQITAFNDFGNIINDDFAFNIDVTQPEINITETSNLDNLTSPADININFTITDTNIDDCTIFINSEIDSIINDPPAFNEIAITLEDEVNTTNHTIQILCEDLADNAIYSQIIYAVTTPGDGNEITGDSVLLSPASCPTTTIGILVIGFLIFVALALIIMAFVFNFGILGFFGAMLMMITGWYIVACSSIGGYIIGVVGIFLMIWFIFSGMKHY